MRVAAAWPVSLFSGSAVLIATAVSALKVTQPVLAYSSLRMPRPSSSHLLYASLMKTLGSRDSFSSIPIANWAGKAMGISKALEIAAPGLLELGGRPTDVPLLGGRAYLIKPRVGGALGRGAWEVWLEAGPWGLLGNDL